MAQDVLEARRLKRLHSLSLAEPEREALRLTIQRYGVLLGKLQHEVGAGNVLYGIENPAISDDITTHAAISAAHHALVTLAGSPNSLTLAGQQLTRALISLTSHITGTLAIGNGGTGQTAKAAAFNALSPVTTRGDMIYRNASNNVRLAKGTAGQRLAQGANDPAWVDDIVTLNFIIDGGGSAITTGVKGDVKVDFACTIQSWEILPDQSGSIVIDIWKDTYANFPPTNTDAMPGAGKEPTLSTATKAQDLDITDWTTDDISAGDILRFNVDSITTVERVTLVLKLKRT